MRSVVSPDGRAEAIWHFACVQARTLRLSSRYNTESQKPFLTAATFRFRYSSSSDSARCTCQQTPVDLDAVFCVVDSALLLFDLAEGSRKFGNLPDPDSEISYILKNKRVFILKEKVGTKPRFFYYFDV